MGTPHHTHRFAFFSRFSGRILEVSGRAQKRAGIALLFAGSILLGMVAKNATQSRSLEEWLRSHPPSETIWKHALAARGYSENKNLRDLPAALDSEGSVWIDSTGERIAIFLSDGAAVPARLYWKSGNRPAKRPRSDSAWSPLGIGWTAFEEALRRIDTQATSLPRIPTRKKGLPQDPREIRY